MFVFDAAALLHPEAEPKDTASTMPAGGADAS